MGKFVTQNSLKKFRGGTLVAIGNRQFGRLAPATACAWQCCTATMRRGEEKQIRAAGRRTMTQDPMSNESITFAPQARSPRLREGESILTTGVYERPPSARPTHDTLENIAAWLIGPARQIASAPQVFDEYAWRLYAAGLPVVRVTLHCGTLHPQFLGSAYVWWRTTAQTQEIMVMHEVVDVVPHAENLVARVRNSGETIRCRLDGPEAQLDFPVLHDIKAQGGTEYFGFPVA